MKLEARLKELTCGSDGRVREKVSSGRGTNGCFLFLVATCVSSEEFAIPTTISAN